MFTKPVNLSDRKEMIAFLENHFRYYTMNSWNCVTSYANNIKIYNLDIPENLRDKAYEFICDDIIQSPLESYIDIDIAEFKEETGYDILINGRCGGYLVLCDTKFDYDKQRPVAMPGRGLDMYEDFEEWEDDDLRKRVQLVQDFDRLTDRLREDFLYILNEYDIEDREITYTRTVRFAVPKE